MTRRAAPAPRSTRVRAGRRSGAGGTLLGVFIGLALGLGLAAAVAFWLMRAPNPYQPSATAKEPSRDLMREPTKTGKLEPGAIEKPRFDFYKILPGAEEPKVQKSAERPAPDKSTVERAAEKPSERAVARTDERAAAEPAARAPAATERFWLQAGSFSGEAEAENLRARLALAGWEAAVQTASLPDKGVRYRVRLGPYDNADELNRVKGELGKRGFDVAVIKN